MRDVMTDDPTTPDAPDALTADPTPDAPTPDAPTTPDPTTTPDAPAATLADAVADALAAADTATGTIPVAFVDAVTRAIRAEKARGATGALLAALQPHKADALAASDWPRMGAITRLEGALTDALAAPAPKVADPLADAKAAVDAATAARIVAAVLADAATDALAALAPSADVDALADALADDVTPDALAAAAATAVLLDHLKGRKATKATGTASTPRATVAHDWPIGQTRRGTYKGTSWTCTRTADEVFAVDDGATFYASPSAAAKGASGQKAVNGWTFWGTIVTPDADTPAAD